RLSYPEKPQAAAQLQGVGQKPKMTEIPTFDDYMIPIINSLRRLGGSATISELYEAVVDEMKLSDEQLSLIHDPEKGAQTEAAYRMAWARTYLKKSGFLTNSERGIWALTPAGREGVVDPSRVLGDVRSEYARKKASIASQPAVASPEAEEDLLREEDEPDPVPSWSEQLSARLLAMAPDAFERLCQRLL